MTQPPPAPERSPAAVPMRRSPALPFVFALAVFALAACVAAGGGTGNGGVGDGAGPRRPGVPAAAASPPYGGIVAASEPEAAAAAAGILKAGGNAVDAAVAGLFALAVIEPQSSGLGGGAFMMIHLAATDLAPARTVIVDSRETAPAAATPGMFGQAPFAIASRSGIAVGVPGQLAGLDAALKAWGTITLAEAMAPAIDLAADGFVVGERLAASIAEGIKPGGRLAAEPGNPAYEAARRVFAAEGVPLAAGARLVQPDLARTLRAIAAGGLPAFYDCDDGAGIARAMIAAQRAHLAGSPELAGRMTCDDLAAAAERGPALREPLSGHYRGALIKTMPPPSSGGLCLLQMLSMLERFPLGDAAAGFGFGTEPTLNVMLDAMRLSFADRALWMGDRDGRPELPLAGLINPGYVHRRAATCPDPDPADADACLKPGARLTAIGAGDPRPYDSAGPVSEMMLAARAGEEARGLETTHLSVADDAGNIVSVTATIEAAWGTGLMVPGYGFLLNNELTDFNLRPAANDDAEAFDPGANDAAPGRRPRSSMAPTMVFAVDDGGVERPLAAYGSPGGASIINTVLNVTLNLIDHGMAVQAAIDAPRLSLSSAADDAKAAIEAGFDAAVLARLAALGYRFAASAPIGSVQAVIVDPATGARHGGADSRRRGTVIAVPRPAAAP